MSDALGDTWTCTTFLETRRNYETRPPCELHERHTSRLSPHTEVPCCLCWTSCVPLASPHGCQVCPHESMLTECTGRDGHHHIYWLLSDCQVAFYHQSCAPSSAARTCTVQYVHTTDTHNGCEDPNCTFNFTFNKLPSLSASLCLCRLVLTDSCTLMQGFRLCREHVEDGRWQTICSSQALPHCIYIYNCTNIVCHTTSRIGSYIACRA